MKRLSTSAVNPVSQQSHDLLAYTSGRWLHLDEEQRQARYINFDFASLCQKVIEACRGVARIVSYEKNEGGFNRVFVFHMDNGKRVIARLPFSLAGCPGLVTDSEVATMSYISSHTSIPVPVVLDWNSSDTNPVGANYMIMEHVPGVQLHEVWPSMSSHQHMLVTKALTMAIVEMASISFPAYGSLYFTDSIVNSNQKIDIGGGFVIGPHCGREFWQPGLSSTNRKRMQSENEGPWHTIAEYANGLLSAGYLHAITSDCGDNDPLSYRGSREEHFRLLEISAKVLAELVECPQIKQASKPMLIHPDLNKRNIYVSADDPTHITSIIDWQSTSVEPCFICADETPDLVTPPPALSVIPEVGQELADQVDNTENKKLQKDYWICRQTFEVILKAKTATLATARTMDETLLRLFSYCHSSSRDGAIILRQQLIELSQRWTELGLQGSCPYQPSAEELAMHAQQWQDFETIQKFKLFLVRTLDSNSDGWVPTEAWESAKQIHNAVFAQWMETVRESEDPLMSEERGRKLWPWNEIST